MLAYLTVAFVAWQLDAGQWSEGARFSAAFIGLPCAVVAALIAGDKK
jgi:hypothetical protein